ncbi:2-C-methyl-D-erythritol 2,4-cyclodiphosphate synthase [Aliikangiella coralliicola]|uniref:2-C-methyl-D-erythritol 2,4-cyclodiphosphate synthase n=1 Tax=Aliikangiella coralliicola TaxID=2592383 RepID=A0A545UDC2_9GAMM|nr:2-C-methyl-D-erythritol 2,4-cyclodiphosphate synthase [Aliikangiella coralliicola]TQV87461.1 2-C-methyl-D-erythritol 2,4-cyclodiphosphate synthase [Aliikangiella coralliicola]
MIRIGHGFDVHAFGGDKPLILGGVEVSDHIGLIAHSDGDVLLHAVCDALLGAAALGDIGRHFPDTDADFAGADSRILLSEVVSLVENANYNINNIDVTVIAQTPKMAPHIESIRKNIATDLKVQINQVNVKATTTEALGYVGRKEGIAVHAVVLLEAV